MTANTISRLCDHPLYNTYRNMIKRCYYSFRSDYYRYGGRGIEVTDRWRGRGGFQQFLDDMGDRPTADHSIERINNEGNYEPSNCRWATILEQRRNMSTNVLIEHNGETKTISEWAELSPLSYRAFHMRISRGYGIERALKEPIHGRKNRS